MSIAESVLFSPVQAAPAWLLAGDTVVSPAFDVTAGDLIFLHIGNASGDGGVSPTVPLLTWDGTGTIAQVGTVESTTDTERLTVYVVQAGANATGRKFTIQEPPSSSVGSRSMHFAGLKVTGGRTINPSLLSSVLGVVKIQAHGQVTSQAVASGTVAAVANQQGYCFWSHRAYNAGTAMSAATGQTELQKLIHTDTTAQNLFQSKTNALVASGGSVSYTQNWTAGVALGGGYIYVTVLPQDSKRVRVTLDLAESGVLGIIGATDVQVWVWNAAGPHSGGHRYDNCTFTANGITGAPECLLDISDMTYNVGDNAIVAIAGTDSITGTVKGSTLVPAKTGVVEAGAGMAWAV